MKKVFAIGAMFLIISIICGTALIGYGVLYDVPINKYSLNLNKSDLSGEGTVVSASNNENSYTHLNIGDTIDGRYILGDANDDNMVNMQDSLTIKRYCAGIAEYINILSSDINEDKIVNAKDLLLLKRFLAGTKIATYTVKFVDYDGKELKSETIEEGKSATAPDNPTREHFTFAGWDKSFNSVTSDLVVTATYTTSKIVISAESVTVNKGTDEVTVNIRVYNNPGIMGAVLKVSVDDQMFTFESGSNDQYPGLTLTSPGAGVTASPYTFLLDSIDIGADDKKDGTLFSITFKVDNLSATGTYDVELSYNNGAIFDENYDDINVVLEDGTITIK